MRFRLRTLLAVTALVAIVLSISLFIINRRREAWEESWTTLNSGGVLLVTSRNDASALQNAEIWVSTINDKTYEVNGQRLSEAEAKDKLRSFRKHLKRLGIRWYVLLDSEPGTTQTRQSTFDLVYAAGFTTYDDIAGQGASTYRQRKSEGEMRDRFYKPNH